MSMRLEAVPIATGACIGAMSLLLTAGLGRATGATDGDDGSAWAFPLVVLALAGLGAAGWVAARRCRSAPLIHAAAAAVGAVVLVSVVAVVRLLVAGDDVRWGLGAVWLLLAVATGIAGGLWALRPSHKANSPG